jgi:hypothetical protein
MEAKKNIVKYFRVMVVLSLCGCATAPVNTTSDTVSDTVPAGEYFISTMTLYDETKQPHIEVVEINEKETFIELVRQILDNPDYEYSGFQNDLYYVAQLYNEFSMAEFTARGGGTFEKINGSGTAGTYKNIITGQLLDISTHLDNVQYDKFKQSLLESGYYIDSEDVDNTKLVMVKNYHDISRLITEVEIDDLLSYTSDKDAFWGIAESVIGLDMNKFENKSEFSTYLKSLLFEEDKQIGEALKKLYGDKLKVGDVVILSYIYKGKKKGLDFIYKPYHDVFIGNLISCYDYIRAVEKSSTWKYLNGY